MSAASFAAIAAAVTVTMACVDYAHARYALAMMEVRRLQDLRQPWRRALLVASWWSVVQWGSAGVAFAVSVKVSMWFLPFEGLGLFVGTLIGGSRTPGRGVQES